MTIEKIEPYNGLPLIPPNIELENKSILKLAIKANTALAKLDGSARQLQNQGILLSSFILQEARMSSEIENVVTTNDELYKAYAGEAIKDSDTKEVLHYREAIRSVYYKVLEKGLLTTNDFIQIKNIIKETDAGVRTGAGTVIKNSITDVIIYTPPEGKKRILDLLKNLEEFINLPDSDIDPLIKMAVIHYQFEAIHPFDDGNGRTGRIINILYLVKEGLLKYPILYLSKYINDNRSMYYKLLRNVTENGDWRTWIEFMLRAVEITSSYTQDKIDLIIYSMDEAKRKIKDGLPKIYSNELLDVIFRQPYCKRKFLVDEGLVKEKTAGVYLRKLEEIGILDSVKIGKEKYYINLRLYDILKS